MPQAYSQKLFKLSHNVPKRTNRLMLVMSDMMPVPGVNPQPSNSCTGKQNAKNVFLSETTPSQASKQCLVFFLHSLPLVQREREKESMKAQSQRGKHHLRIIPWNKWEFQGNHLPALLGIIKIQWGELRTPHFSLPPPQSPPPSLLLPLQIHSSRVITEDWSALHYSAPEPDPWEPANGSENEVSKKLFGLEK